MKKAYTKPLIAMESFQLNAAIAASCSSQGYQPIDFNEETCSYDIYFGTSCLEDVTGGNNVYGDNNDELCYHGPIAAGVVFVYS